MKQKLRTVFTHRRNLGLVSKSIEVLEILVFANDQGFRIVLETATGYPSQ